MPCGFQRFYAGRFAVQHFEGDVMESHFLLTAPGSLGPLLWQLEPCGPAALVPRHLLELTLEVFRLREAQVEEPGGSAVGLVDGSPGNGNCSHMV